MLKVFKRLLRDEEGQGLVEYALIIVVISLVILVAGNAVKEGLDDAFTKIGNRLKGVGDTE